MFSGLFDMDKPFWRWMGKLPDLVGLTLLFYLCCIPIITIIPAACALFDAVSRCTVPDVKGCFTRFFRTFYKELKQGIPLTLLFLTFLLVALMGKQIMQQNAPDTQLAQIFSLMYLLTYIFISAYLCWLVPLQSRYHHSFLHLLRNAFLFSIARLPGTVGMLLISVAVMFISTATSYTLPLLLLAPALIAALHTRIVENGFDRAFPRDESEQADTSV